MSNHNWWQPELPFDEPAPEALRKRIYEEIQNKPAPKPEPIYKTGFLVLVAHDGEICINTAPDFEALGFTVSRRPINSEIERAAHAVSEHEKRRDLVDAIVARLQPRDLVQDSLRAKARERGVV